LNAEWKEASCLCLAIYLSFVRVATRAAALRGSLPARLAHQQMSASSKPLAQTGCSR
jgi:hypothetical protein